jgi:hypothetical protein
MFLAHYPVRHPPYPLSRWVPRVVSMVEDLCPQVGEALTPDKKELLVRFVRRLALIMTAQLRFVVQQSVEAFVQIWEQFAVSQRTPLPEAQRLPSAPVSPRAHGQNARAGLGGQMKTRALCEPIFEVQLTVEGDRFEFVPKLSELEDTVSGWGVCLVVPLKNL